MSPKTSVGYLAIVFLLGMPFFSCTATEENSLSTIQSDYITDAEEAYGIAYKAYLFFYPVVENLRCLSLSMGYPNRPEHTAFNSFHHNDRALAPNDYVLYSTVWLDLRQEPKVLTVPMIEDR